MIRRVLVRAAAAPASGSVFGLLENLCGRGANLLRGLTYHDLPDGTAFEAQMQLVQRSFQPVSGARVVAALGGGEPLPARAVLVTFDDAYESFARIAWPILRRLGIPAVLFVPTSYPDRPDVFWWERIDHAFLHTERRDEIPGPFGPLALGGAEQRRHSLVRLKGHVKALPYERAMGLVDEVCELLDAPPLASPVLGWDELRALARDGVEMGAHTRTHPFLDSLPVDAALAEVRGSLDDMERELGSRPELFAYPDGRYTRELAERLGELGLTAAFTTQRGASDLAEVDPMRLRRTHAGADDSPALLRARLAFSTRPLNRWRRILDRNPGAPLDQPSD